MSAVDALRLRGAREHNLRGVDLDLPLGRWIAVVGPSGSGKTSLAVDTIVREGQRRVLGALSARARQLYGKLGRAAVDRLDGLPAAVAVGQGPAAESARSTVGTLTGALDLLRLLFAREAADPGGVALTRSHFSFNHPDGACEACQGVGLEDRVAPELLVADPSRSIRAGALRPTLKSGYTVYSQVTVEVMDTICRAHGFTVDTPWSELTDAQRDVVFHGTKALKVPFGKHSIESRMKWEGITARPREEGYYRGLVPVIEETLQRNRNPNILRFVSSVPCTTCGGARLGRPGREAALGSWRLPALAVLPARELPAAVDALPASAVLDALRPALDERLARMTRLSLGHLSLDRTAPTLSGGEGQRLRLAAQLTAGLGRQLVALDEPTLGLHPSEQEGMAAVLDELRALGNTLLVVEHDPDMVRRADHLVRLGPGAGSEGGRVLESAPLTAGGEAPLGRAPPRKAHPRVARDRLVLRGATLHNLQDATLDVGLGTLHVVTGPSGAGKSSLVFGTLLPALLGEAGGPFTALEGGPGGPGGPATGGARGAQAVDARPIGRTPRSTPATWSGLFDLVRKRFADEPEAKDRGFGAGRFSYNNKEGRCPTCEGLGFERVGLHLLEDLELACGACGGGRYEPETLAVTHRGLTIAQVLALTVREAREVFADDEPVHALCRAMDELGLGYLPLGHASNRLSRGEGQRIKLATLLGSPGAPGVVLLDEPDRGLHPDDVAQLLAALDALVDGGHTVVAISHHRHLWAAADELTALSDGVARRVETLDLEPLLPVRGARPAAARADAIRLRGVATHNLRDVDATFPHGALTAVAGVSGSGKSSLVFDTLAAEAWRRFAESLPFAVRRFVQRLPAPTLEAAEGLGPVLALRPGQGRAGERSTVATQSELGPLLRLLWSRAGTLDGAPCGFTAGHFSTAQALGACLTCEGRGATPRSDPARLVTHPELPLAAGALGGTRPGRFFSEPDGQHVATLRAAIAAAGLGGAGGGAGDTGDAGGDDPLTTTPWRDLPEAVRRLALDGTGDTIYAVTWSFKRGARTGEHAFDGPWEGLLHLVEREARRRVGAKAAAEWRAPLVDEPCAACGGAGLRDEVARVEVGGLTLPAVLRLAVSEVGPALRGARDESAAPEVVDALLPELEERLDDLAALGLGHLGLGRRSGTLSDGELQRVRLASVLRSGLTGMTFALDEPARGLHADDVARLVERLRLLVDDGNTVVVVSHRPELLRVADHLVEVGPGAGAEGGRLLEAGPPGEVLSGDGPTAAALRAVATRPARADAAPADRFHIRGARANTLRDLDLDLPLAGFVCLTGVSGSGKSSLLFEVLEASARAGAPVACDAVVAGATDGADDAWPLARFASVHSSREARRGQVVLTALDLMAPLQAHYHGAAAGSDLKKAAFSFLSPSGRCERCKGSGREEVAMDFLADLALPCGACEGRRYRDDVLAVRWDGLDAAAFLAAPVGELAARLAGDAASAGGKPAKPVAKLGAGLEALVDVGLGHLALDRRWETLSGGERQRVGLAMGLAGRGGPTLHLLDEPATGLHEADVARLLAVVDRLVARGDLVVAAEHRASLIAAADEVLTLGPGSGPEGGRLVEHARR